MVGGSLVFSRLVNNLKSTPRRECVYDVMGIMGIMRKKVSTNNTYLFVSLRWREDNNENLCSKGCFLKINSPFTCRIFQLKIKLTRSIFSDAAALL